VSLNSQGDYQDVSPHFGGAINTRSAVSVVYLLKHSLSFFALTLAEHVRTRSFHFGRQNTAGRIGSRARSTLHIRCLAPLISDAVGLDGGLHGIGGFLGNNDECGASLPIVRRYLKCQSCGARHQPPPVRAIRVRSPRPGRLREVPGALRRLTHTRRLFRIIRRSIRRQRRERDAWNRHPNRPA
jgi:hypothetical protein